MPTVKGLSNDGQDICLYSCSLLSEAIRWANSYTSQDPALGGHDTIIVNDAGGATVYTIPSPETSED